jgi:hypothetical protein
MKKIGRRVNKKKVIKRGLEKKVKEKKADLKPSAIPVYRTIALIFLASTLLMVLVVFYLISAQAKIIIKAKPKVVKTDFEVTLQQIQESECEADKNCLLGRIFTAVVEAEETFPATQIELEEKKAYGEVIIINNYVRPQTLVKTTRLLSPEGILFRTDYTIQVPPGGRTKVSVHADKPGLTGEIAPCRFTIPGLWPGLQDKIFGISHEPMKDGLIEIKIVSQADIQQAKDILENKLAQKALEEVIKQRNPKAAKLRKNVFQLTSQEILETNIDAEVGDRKDEFKAKMKLKLIALEFNEKEMFSLAEEKLKSLVPQNMKLIPLEKRDITYILESYDPENQTAVLEVYPRGKVVITKSHPLLVKDPLIRKNRKEVKAYLEKFPEIESVQVEFSPFWIKRVPILRDRIKIEISSLNSP